MKQDFKIRRFQEDDAPPVFRLCSAIPELSPWPLSDFENVQDAGFEGWIAETETRIVGFVITRCASDELEILQLGTAPEFRRQGVASALLAAAFVAAASQGVRRAFLEVRASNAPAISLYQAAGFHLTGRRPNYYSAPAEDGLRMTCDLDRNHHFPIGG
ncbi:MAG TPA: ribosomal protein S18-alanine N-acetyltransferase [Candidatus Acidoferrales bacterium]|nr:ribosomal protein S18-alanine N-acetyltransferase [Candidatus Acidoferrales bacterium]